MIEIILKAFEFGTRIIGSLFIALDWMLHNLDIIGTGAVIIIIAVIAGFGIENLKNR